MRSLHAPFHLKVGRGEMFFFVSLIIYNVVRVPNHMQAVPESAFEQDVQIQTVANPMGRRVDSEENQTLVTPPEGAEAENTQGG